MSRTLLYEESRCSLNYLRCDILWSYYVFCACFEQVWRTPQSVFHAGRAPSVKPQALPRVTFAPGTLTLEREPVRVHHALKHSIPVRRRLLAFFVVPNNLHMACYYHFSKNPIQSSNKHVCVCVCVRVLEEGWSQCKERPPCSEKDYFQIHTACDSDGKVGKVECRMCFGVNYVWIIC